MGNNLIEAIFVITFASMVIIAILGYIRGKQAGVLKSYGFAALMVALAAIGGLFGYWRAGFLGLFIAVFLAVFPVGTVILAAIAGFKTEGWLGAILAGLGAIIILTLTILGVYVLLNSEYPGLGYLAFSLAGLFLISGTLGRWGSGWMGAAIVTGLTLLGLAIITASMYAGAVWGGLTGGGIGLILATLVSGIIIGFLFGKVTRGGWKASRFAFGIWCGFVFSVAYSLSVAGWAGILTITLPTIVVFWGGLYWVSKYLLPLREPIVFTERKKAFRSLMTFTMGTNYPYYFVDEKSQPELRVKGNQFLQFFAGPGFVVTPPDHAVYITEKTRRNLVYPPGLAFTTIFDQEPKIIDLRVQLRAFPVEAITSDGISVNVFTFIPYRVDTGEQELKYENIAPEHNGQPASFPFKEVAVHKIMRSQLTHRKADKENDNKSYKWDGGPDDGLIPIIATPIVQDIISHYTVNELCAPYNPTRDPRVEIAAAMRTRVQEAVDLMGLKLVGGGISNLVPQDSGVIERRLENWRTKWVGGILATLSSARAQRTYGLEKARAEVDVEIVKRFGDWVKRGSNKMDIAMALRYIDTMGDIVAEQWPLPNKSLDTTLKQLRGEVDKQKGSDD